MKRQLIHLWVLLHVQPAHVREEEPACGVVRVCVLLGVLVVHPVVPGPVVDGALVGHRVDKHEEYASCPVRIVGSVGPQAVHAPGDSKPPGIIRVRVGVKNRGAWTRLFEMVRFRTAMMYVRTGNAGNVGTRVGSKRGGGVVGEGMEEGKKSHVYEKPNMARVGRKKKRVLALFGDSSTLGKICGSFNGKNILRQV